MSGAAHPKSPARALLLGLVITLGLVIAYSTYFVRQISDLRRLQTEMVDRNRRGSLQLLRIQNNLNQIGLAMRDMLDGDQPYSLTAWAAQFERARRDLDDALVEEAALAGRGRSPDQTRYLASSVAQFWDAVDRMFALAEQGEEEQARIQIRETLQARQAALSTAVARFLVQNNEQEEQTSAQMQDIYNQVERQGYVFLGATLVAIAATSLYLIGSNRRLFAQLGALSAQRQELARSLLDAREGTLQEVSRELHDGLGQLLTAIGLMLGRAAKRAPEGTPVRAELREIGEVAQTALDNVRGLSQTLHPSILEELGLESTIEWYLSTVEKHFNIRVSYERSGPPADVAGHGAIHVYRILQEAVSNVARHSGAELVAVRLRMDGGMLALDVEDAGKGLEPGRAPRGLGLVAMRERAQLLGGSIAVEPRPGGGTRVRLVVPRTA